MRIALTDAAEEDLAAIYAYSAARSAAADCVIGTILKAINGLAMFPRMGRPGDVPESRERIVARYPYRVVYHIDEANEVIEVWRVVHRARQWPPVD